jgi:hypothetical protein
MLVLSYQALIRRPEGPSIGVVNNVVRTDREEGLNGEHEPFVELRPLTIIDRRDEWGFVQNPADAMTTQVSNDPKAMTASSPLNRLPNLTQLGPGSCRLHRIVLSQPRCFQEPRCHRRYLTNGNADASVGKVTVQFGRHVEVYEITIS